MAEKIVSPGVFTNEIDASFLPAAVADIGAVVVGPTKKGPAFKPTIVESFSEFEQIFGGVSDKTYVPYTVQSYLRSAGRVTIVRTLSLDGYVQKNVSLTDGATQAATYASGTATFTELTDATDVTLTVDGVESTFTGILGAVPSDPGNNQYYYQLTAVGPSNEHTTSIAALAAEIHALDSVNAVATVNNIEITSAVAGTKFNGFTFVSASTTTTSEGAIDATGGNTIAVFAPTVTNTTYSSNVDSSTITGTLDEFNISFDGTTKYSGSLNPTSKYYIEDVFGWDPEGNAKVYIEQFFPIQASASTATDGTKVPTIDYSTDFDYGGSANDLDGEWHASTPWIQSQTGVNLFKFHTLSHGDIANREIKVGIQDMKKAGTVAGSDFAHFTVVVRKFSDKDTKLQTYETFQRVNLDPDSPDFLPRRIGDRYSKVDDNGKIVNYGDWPNKSNYIRVELDGGSNGTSVGAKKFGFGQLPFGFAAYQQTIPSTLADTPSVDYITSQTGSDGAINTKTWYGVDFDETTGKDNKQWHFKQLTTATAVDAGGGFSLGSSVTDDGGSLTIDTLGDHQKKFIVGFQGGIEGLNPSVAVNTGADIVNTNTYGYAFNTADAEGNRVYKKALTTISNPDEYDVNLILTPGIIAGVHTTVYNKARDICEDRGDCFYVTACSIEGEAKTTSGITGAISRVQTADTNYVATYYPWVKIVDSGTQKPTWVPPDVVLSGVIAYTDKVAHEWFAPAGLNRGGLTEVIEAETRLTHAERDSLYEERVNPIASFPGEGVCVWGQKTLQGKPSALDRVNVRRLLIKLKKFIASSSRYLVFEQNTAATRNKFLNIVNPYLESVQSNSGLSAFRVVMDETNNTPDIVDRNIMYGQIFIQPTRTAEFIVLDFTIQPTGASFPE